MLSLAAIHVLPLTEQPGARITKGLVSKKKGNEIILMSIITRFVLFTITSDRLFFPQTKLHAITAVEFTLITQTWKTAKFFGFFFPFHFALLINCVYQIPPLPLPQSETQTMTTAAEPDKTNQGESRHLERTKQRLMLS